MVQVFFVLLGFLSIGSQSANAHQDPYFEIKEVRLEEVGNIDSLRVIPLTEEAPIDWAQEIDLAAIIFDKIVNLGSKVWTIVELNKPVYEIKEQIANAVPYGIQDWRQLSSWKAPLSKTFRMTYVNGFGMEVIELQYQTQFSYGGGLNGKGQYIAQATVLPAHVSVMWGYKLNSEVQVDDTLNAGSSESPIAGLKLTVRWAVDTAIKHQQGAQSFYMQGNGIFKDLEGVLSSR